MDACLYPNKAGSKKRTNGCKQEQHDDMATGCCFQKQELLAASCMPKNSMVKPLNLNKETYAALALAPTRIQQRTDWETDEERK